MVRTLQTTRKSMAGRIPSYRAFARRTVPRTPPQEEVPQDFPEYTPTPTEELQRSTNVANDPEPEDDPSDPESDPIEPMEAEGGDPEPDRATKMYIDGRRAGKIREDLLALLEDAGAVPSLVYHIMRVPRGDRVEWSAMVTAYNEAYELRTHYSQAPRDTPRAAMQDATWEAMMAYADGYSDRLRSSVYRYFPRRKSGRRKVTKSSRCRALSAQEAETMQKAFTRMTRHHISAREENLTLRAALKASEKRNARLEKMFRGEEDDADSARTWSPNSPRRVAESPWREEFSPMRIPPPDVAAAVESESSS